MPIRPAAHCAPYLCRSCDLCSSCGLVVRSHCAKNAKQRNFYSLDGLPGLCRSIGRADGRDADCEPRRETPLRADDDNQPFSASTKVLPRRAGEGDTIIPADSMAAIFDPASPLPPEIIAPAWPMRRPGGAVRPAMKPTTGFLRPRLASSLRNCAASSSDDPPISPLMTIALVASSARNISSTAIKAVPLIGSPPLPTAVVWPRPSCVVWKTAS